MLVLNIIQINKHIERLITFKIIKSLLYVLYLTDFMKENRSTHFLMFTYIHLPVIATHVEIYVSG